MGRLHRGTEFGICRHWAYVGVAGGRISYKMDCAATSLLTSGHNCVFTQEYEKEREPFEFFLIIRVVQVTIFKSHLYKSSNSYNTTFVLEKPTSISYVDWDGCRVIHNHLFQASVVNDKNGAHRAEWLAQGLKLASDRAETQIRKPHFSVLSCEPLHLQVGHFTGRFIVFVGKM